jgi:hypothetical protein
MFIDLNWQEPPLFLQFFVGFFMVFRGFSRKPHKPFLITGLLVSAHLLRSPGGDLLAHATGADLFALEGLQHLNTSLLATSIHIYIYFYNKLVKSCKIRMFFCCLKA